MKRSQVPHAPLPFTGVDCGRVVQRILAALEVGGEKGWASAIDELIWVSG